MDTIVIGGGLAGLLLTHRLHEAGHKVTLLEGRDHLGGTHRRPMLNFFAATRDNMELCEWLKAHSPTPLAFEVVEHRPEIFEEAHWHAFAGFLDSEFKTLGELSHLSHTHEIQIKPGPDQIVRALIEQLPVVAQLQAEVTEIKFTNESASEVVVNGDKSLKAEQIFFTGSPVALNKLIVTEALPAKHRSRLAKVSNWTAVVLEIQHPTPIAESGSMRLFNHSSKEFEPVFGRIDANISRWATLVHSERADEHEFTGQCIRHIKRQLKRAWPEVLEGKPVEKIYVLPAAYGQNNLKTKSPWLLPEIPNLFLVGHTLATQAGFFGSIEAVKGVEALIAGTDTPALDHLSKSRI